MFELCVTDIKGNQLNFSTVTTLLDSHSTLTGIFHGGPLYL